MTHGPVVLRLCYWPTCGDEMQVVSQRWWDRFLLSQAIALKIPLDTGTGRTSISHGSTITNVNLEPREETGRRGSQNAAG